MNYKVIVICFLALNILSVLGKIKLYPYPKHLEFKGANSNPIYVKGLQYKFINWNNGNELSSELIKDHYIQFESYLASRLNKFNENINNQNQRQLNVVIKLDNIDSPIDYSDKYDKAAELYEIVIDQQGEIHLQCKGYLSFLRAIETLFQLFENDKSGVYLENYPISISDEPSYSYRGVMLDPARNFLYIPDIKRIINGMQIAKLNYLHIHFTDSESFPIQIASYPQIAKAGAYSTNQTYSKSDLQDLVQYGLQRGVTVIPELDSPAHSRSWALSDDLKVINSCYDYPPSEFLDYCAEPPCGQFDPTLDLTYKVVKSVFDEIQATFPSHYIHLGGDEINTNCWDYRPSIKSWMQAHNISDYNALQSYYRNIESSYIESGRQKVFWFFTVALDVELHSDDVIQYWDSVDNYDVLTKLQNEIILSPYDALYMDCGTGATFGEITWCDPFKTWRDIYNYNMTIEGVNNSRILGAEVPLWGEVQNYNNVDGKIFPRASALAERLWNNDYQDTLKELVVRLTSLNNIMISQNISVSPLTSEYCEKNVDMCFFS